MLHHRLLALVASTSLAALATPGFAQTAATVVAQNTSTAAQNTPAPPTDQATSTVTTVSEIVVTAEKRSERLSQVPMGITAVPGVTLDKLQERSFEDYAATIPGLSLTSSQPGVTRLTLRGENTGGVGSTVATYIDESPFGSSTALLNGSILTGDFDTFDLQRIEVLRGPQGTLYGANSEGGLIKFVTNAPKLGQYAGTLEATGEMVDHSGGDWSVHGMINVPIGDKVAVRVMGFDQELPGYIDDPASNRLGVNGGFRDGYRASVLFQPIDRLSIRLSAFGQETMTRGTSVEDVDPTTLAPVLGDLIQHRVVDERSDFQYQNYNATVGWDFGPINLISATTYSLFDTYRLIDETAAFHTGADLENDTHLNKFTEEVRLASPASERLEWQVGGFYTRENARLPQRLDLVSVATRTAYLPGAEVLALNSTYTEYAGFGDVTYHFSPQFDVQVGGRYASNKQSATENISGPLVGGVISYSTPSSGDAFTYSVAPRWHVDPNTMVYGRIATGFRPGGPNVLPPSAPASVPHQYNSDSTTNYEIGVRSALLNRRLSIDIAAFHIDWSKIQLFEVVAVPPPPNAPPGTGPVDYGINGNGGAAQSDGVEYTFGLVPTRGLTFTLTGAYTDARLTEDAPGVNAKKGDRLPFAPRWSDSLDGEYDWDAFSDYQAFFGGTVSYVGKRSSEFSTTSSQVVLPSYTTVGLRTGLQNRRWLFEVYAKNLGDVRGITAYGEAGTALNGLGTIGVIQPLTIGVLLSVKY